MGVSLKPSDAVSGGLLNDVTVEWKNCRFGMFDYKGKANAAPAFVVDLVDAESGEEYEEQAWSVGRDSDWAPSDDGNELVAVGSQEHLRNSSNFILLVTSLVNCGMDEDKIETTAEFFNGTIAHMIRVPAPKRAGLKKEPRKDDQGNEYEDTIFVADEIIKMPWEKKKSSKKQTGGGKKSGGKKDKEKDDAGDDDINDITSACLLRILSNADDGEVPKKSLPQLALKDDELDQKTKNKVVALIFKDTFLKQDGAAWTLEKGVVRLGE